MKLRTLLAAATLTAPAVGQTSVIRTVFGDDDLEEFGMSVASVGDANLDGVADFVVGCPEDSALAARAGRAVLFSGADGAQLHEFTSTAGNGNFGRSVAPAGDVDGDGCADVVVGRPWQILGGVGKVFTYSGATGALLREWTGAAAEAFGHDLANLGDLDGDGIDEIAVSAYLEGNDDHGAVRVLDGATGSVVHSFAGTNGSDQFGWDIATGGDVDDDGFLDLIVGSVLQGSHGGVRVFSGQTGNLLFSLDGVAGDSGFGRRVALIGDVDGDDRSEFAFVDTVTDSEGHQHAHVHSGATGLRMHSVGGAAGGDGFGEALAGVGDVDGDTIPDYAVGAPGDDDLGSASGSLNVYSGADGSLIARWYGVASGRAQGQSIDGAGDLNGDGIPDILVGCSMPRHSSANLGYVRAYSGRCLGSITPYGSASAGSGGFVPQLSAEGCPAPTAPLKVHVDDALGGVGGLLLIGFNPMNAPFAGGALLVSPPWIKVPLFIPGSGAGNGSLTLATTLRDNLVVPFRFYLQCIVYDPGAVDGLALTEGLDIELR